MNEQGNICPFGILQRLFELNTDHRLELSDYISLILQLLWLQILILNSILKEITGNINFTTIPQNEITHR
jgi:hypothetical protein